MDWLNGLLIGKSVGHILVVLAFVVALGMILGRIKICGVSLGATFVLLVGIAASHFGMQYPAELFTAANGEKHFIDPEVLHFVQEFGLILFVYAVGLQAGPGFFSAFKKGGLKLNALAVAVISLDVAIAIAIRFITGISTPTVVGILSGAVTNTPGLGAAQSTYNNMVQANAELAPCDLGTAYAMAYPLGVLGIIFTIIAIRFVFKIDVEKENQLLQAAQKESPVAQKAAESEKKSAGVPIVPIFVGIALGVILGSVPIVIPGVPQPLKLGLAGGPLVVAILMGAFGEKIHFPTRISKSANALMREIGICLFLACVGLKCGENFVETVMDGGLLWVGLGVIITVVPLAIVGTLAYKVFQVDYFTLAGMLSGCMTDPPALSYSVSAVGNDRPSVGYATVYPLTMFLRIMTAQLLIVFFV